MARALHVKRGNKLHGVTQPPDVRADNPTTPIPGEEEDIMGCDIHMHVELREYAITTDQPPWRLVMDREATYGERHYGLFGLLAGVRGHDKTPISAPKGLPQDISPEVAARAAMWDVDGHSWSYFTLAELFAVDWTAHPDERDVFLPWLESLTNKGPTRLGHRKPEDVRIVFWFDN